MLYQDLPLISIVTVVYNGASHIEETIASVVNQEYPRIQYIIIDGGSTDNTLEIVNRYADKIDIIVSEPDKGIYDAMNKSIPYCKGDWVNFMNAGDVFYSPEILHRIFSNQAVSEGDLIYGNHEVSYGSFKVMKIPRPIQQLWKGMTIQHQSTFTKTELLRSRGFDLQYLYAADFDLFYNFLQKGAQIIYLKECLSTVSANGFSESNSIGTYLEYVSIALKYEDNRLGIKLYFYFKTLERKVIHFIKRNFPKFTKKRIAKSASNLF